MEMPKRILAALVMMVCFGGITAWCAAPGVSESEIVVGQSCALDGPAQALGQGMKVGLEAAFKEANDAGGINGRQIRLISRDDGYEPEKAIASTNQLIQEDKVFLLIGEVGTPTSKAVVPIAEKEGVPFFGPFTGAEFLRNPFKPLVVNVRGSYYQEMEGLAAYLVDKKGLKRIACFYQNDGYGQAGLAGIEKALKARGMELCATGTYERNTTAVKSGLLDVRRGNPEAVIMVGAYKACAEFIRMAHKVRMNDVIYCNISFVGTQALKQELGADGEGCIISQVVVHPKDTSIPVVKAYQQALEAIPEAGEPGYVSLEGYLVGKLFCQVTAAVDGELTRESFLAAIQKQKSFDLGGVILEFGDQDHQGQDVTFLTVIKDGDVVPLEQ